MSEFERNMVQGDEDLKELMGDKFQVGKFENPGKEKVQSGNEGKFSYPRQEFTRVGGVSMWDEVMNEEDEPEEVEAPAFFQKTPDFFDKLKASARSGLTYSGLYLLIYYWMQQGMVAEGVAVPCMCVCALLAGWGVGRVFGKEHRK